MARLLGMYDVTACMRMSFPHSLGIENCLNAICSRSLVYSNFPLIIRGNHNDGTSLLHFVP
jgi:hypothetical protein